MKSRTGVRFKPHSGSGHHPVNLVQVSTDPTQKKRDLVKSRAVCLVINSTQEIFFFSSSGIVRTKKKTTTSGIVRKKLGNDTTM